MDARHSHADEIEQLQQAIAALDAQRTAIGDALVESALGPMREKLKTLQAAASREQQRKLVTILFADVSGFTALSESLDIEDVTTLIDSLWQRIDQQITSRGGRIDKHIGDAVMAIWGVEQAREDDAEQAIRAALQMQADLAEFRQQNQAQLALRIGIHTGYALLGQVGTTNEFTAMGDAVNLASRLEHAAPLDGVLISEDTYRLVGDAFEIERQPLLDVKGKSEPVQTYRVDAARPSRFRMEGRGVEGIQTPTIGRRRELESLQTHFRRAFTQESSQVTIIAGEPGIGKSRLLDEFLDWVERQAYKAALLKGRATPETLLQPAGLLHNLFSEHLNIRDTDRPEALRDKLVDGMAALVSRDKAAVIGQLAGFDLSSLPGVQAAVSSPNFDEMALAYLAEYCQRLAGDQPLALLLEDIHWADDRSLDLLARLIATLRGQSLFILCLARPRFFESHPGWGDDLGNFERIDLKPLSDDDSQLLVAEILRHVEHLPETFSQALVAQADGNPYYIEELIKMLIDQGVIRRGAGEGDPWRVRTEKLTNLKVPTTLAGVLQARIDRLLPDEREALQRASIIGRLFWDGAVDYLAINQAGASEIAPTWSNMCARELVFPNARSTFDGMHEYLFKHALLRDVVYESVLKRLRRIYHQRAAEWLIQAGATRADELASLVASHYKIAGDYQQEAIWQRRAGMYAAGQYAHTDALRSLSRSLELTPADDFQARFELLWERERIYQLQGERQLQDADLTALEILAQQIGNPHQRARVFLQRSIYHNSLGDFTSAATSAEQGYQIAIMTQDIGLQGEALLRWAWTLYAAGDYHLSQEKLQRALDYLEQSQDRRLLSEALRCLGVLAQVQGDYTTSHGYYQRAYLLAHELGDRWTERRILNSLGALSQGSGEFRQARGYFETSWQLANEIGDRMGQCIVLTNLAALASLLGDYQAAEPQIQQALQIAQDIGDRAGELNLLINQGDIAYLNNDFQASLVDYQQALSMARELGSRSDEGYAQSGIGWALLRQGQPAEALSWFETALDLRLELGEMDLAIDPRTGLAQARWMLGDVQPAREQVEIILDTLQNQGVDDLTLRLNALLTCYKILQPAGDERGLLALQQAYHELQHHADQLDESHRLAFLKNVPWNREITHEAGILGLV